MDLRNKVTSIFKNISEFLFSTEDRGRCVYCHNVVGDPDEVFCSQRCSLRYWTEYREKQGGLICGYPGCGKPCFVDANKAKMFDFCGWTHAKEFKELLKLTPPQGSFRPGSCGYPDCPKPCYVDHTTGMVHMFCGQTHATQYKELQTSGTVHDTTHKRTVVTRHASRTAGHLQNSDGPINFYGRDEPYYEFTNFYEHAISIDGKKWNTSEHYFQAQKFVGTPYMEIIRNMQRPRDAFDLSRDPFVSPWLRSDWETVKLDVMYKALLAKFSQHNNLKALLLRTGKRELIEHTSNDKFWGDGGDGRGHNNLGKLLMRVREVLKNSSVTPDGDDGEVGVSLSDMSDRDHSCKGGDIGTLLDFVDDIELIWPESDEEQPPCSLEQHTDGSDAVGQNGENLMDEGSLTPAVIDHDKNSNGVETGQMPEIPLSVRSDVDKAEPMEVGGDQNKNSV